MILTQDHVFAFLVTSVVLVILVNIKNKINMFNTNILLYLILAVYIIVVGILVPLTVLLIIITGLTIYWKRKKSR